MVKGRLKVAVVPHVPGKTSAAVRAIEVVVALRSLHNYSGSWCPACSGKFCLAQAGKLWILIESAVLFPVDVEARSGSMAEEEKNWWCAAMIGPPMVAETLLLWYGEYL